MFLFHGHRPPNLSSACPSTHLRVDFPLVNSNQVLVNPPLFSSSTFFASFLLPTFSFFSFPSSLFLLRSPETF